jgi:hypothetical protein
MIVATVLLVPLAKKMDNMKAAKLLRNLAFLFDITYCLRALEAWVVSLFLNDTKYFAGEMTNNLTDLVFEFSVIFFTLYLNYTSNAMERDLEKKFDMIAADVSLADMMESNNS